MSEIVRHGILPKYGDGSLLLLDQTTYSRRSTVRRREGLPGYRETVVVVYIHVSEDDANLSAAANAKSRHAPTSA